MIESQALTRNQVVSVLTKSPHGELSQYLPVAVPAARQDPDFFGHLVAWNHWKGQVRDAKVALPIAALTADSLPVELRDNALGAVSLLGPRELVRAVRFVRSVQGAGRRSVYRAAEAALRRWENPKAFDRIALQHRRSLQELYALLHLKPSELANETIFGHARSGVFADVSRLASLPAAEAAGLIVTKRIPFLVAAGALGKRAREPELLRALIDAMSPTELVNNSKALQRMGVQADPVLRAAYDAGLARVAASDKAVLKTSVAAAATGGAVGEKLAAAQERQAKRSVQGDWLVAADRSSSMSHAIETARHVAAALARFVAGKVHLVFFNGTPTYYDATGKTLEQITAMTASVVANGNTSIGCPLAYAVERDLPVDGVALVTDGGDNAAPLFRDAYPKLCAKLEKDVPAYCYLLRGDRPVLLDYCQLAGIDLQVFDMRGGTDYYALPNLVQTMRTNRYSLADEIMETPLLRFEGAKTKGEQHAREAEAA